MDRLLNAHEKAGYLRDPSRKMKNITDIKKELEAQNKALQFLLHDP